MSLIKPISFLQREKAIVSAPIIQLLPHTGSLFAYYDVAFTCSYSSSGQTQIFDLSNNGRTGTVVGTVNYNDANVSGKVLRLGASSNSNRVDMPQLTLSTGNTAGVSFVIAHYINSASYQFNYTELFVGRDPEAYGIFAGNNTVSARAAFGVNDVFDTTNAPINSMQSGSWHISQMSFDDVGNTLRWCMDGVTGSATLAATISTGIITPKWNFNNTGLGNRFLNSGSMMQVMAVYTGSLTSQQMLDNHNALKGRYGLP